MVNKQLPYRMPVGTVEILTPEEYREIKQRQKTGGFVHISSLLKIVVLNILANASRN